MKKKIFIVSKIYDTEKMTDEDIRIAVQADIDRLIKREGVVEFEIIRQAKEIDLVFHRGLEYPNNKLQQGLMADADGYLVCGIGLDGFRLPKMWGEVSFGCSYFFEQAVFKESYKESAVKLGGNRIKDLELEVGKEALVMKLKWE